MSSKEEKAFLFRNTLRNYPDPSKYEELNEIGKGAFGVVKGVNRESGQFVAMKKLIVEPERSSESVIMLMREIQILRSVKFENIINLYEVCTRKPSLENLSTEIYLILELCKQDLTSMLEIREVSRHEKKQILEQLFKGINYLHSNQIMHRDLKPDNILMTETGILKIGDFGSAKKYDPEYNPLTFPYSVVSLWYRAPELLLNDPNYSPIIDLWAAGCIMAELWTRKVIMKGRDKRPQLIAILGLCGSITPEVWPGVDNLNLYREMDLPKYLPRQVKQLLQPLMMDYWACDLLDNLLVLNPQQRLNAGAALRHPFFNSENDDHVDSA